MSESSISPHADPLHRHDRNMCMKPKRVAEVASVASKPEKVTRLRHRKGEFQPKQILCRSSSTVGLSCGR